MSTYAANISDLESSLAARLKARKNEAFEELYRDFGRRIFAVCVRPPVDLLRLVESRELKGAIRCLCYR